MSEQTGQGTGISERAAELRSTLGARQEAEAILAEASQIRRSAAADADSIVEEAQGIADQLIAEARQTSERLTTSARQQADDVVAEARREATEVTDRAMTAAYATRQKAEDDAEELRRQYRAEVAEEHRQQLLTVRQESDALIGGMESSVDGIGARLDAAAASVSDVLRTLGELRRTTVENLPDPDGAPVTAESVERQGSPRPHEGQPALIAEAEAASATEAEAQPEPEGQHEPEGHDDAVAVAESVSETPESEQAAQTEQAEQSGDADLFQEDQGAETTAEEGHAENGRSDTADEETLAVMPETERKREQDEQGEGSRPLGWLFRAPQ